MRDLTCNARHGLAFFAAVLMAGCVQVEQTLSLHADGTGQLDVSYGMSMADIAKMQAMSKQAFAGGGATNEVEAPQLFNFNEEDIRKDFKAYEQHGVKLLSVSTEESNDWKHVHLSISFTSLEGLARTEFINDRTLSLERDAQSNYVFRQVANENGDNGAATNGDQAAIAAAMADVMKGFRAVMIVRTPSRILSSNAATSDVQSATWEFDLAKDPKALERAQKLDMQVRFDGAGLSLPEFKPAPGG